MTILYLAIILVILGFIFVVTSVEVRKETVIEKVPVRRSAKRTEADQKQSAQEVSDFSQPHLSDAFRNENSLDIDEVIIKEQAPSSTQEDSSAKSLYDVILYIDANGISLESGQLDPAALNKVVREGAGTAEISSDSLMVRIGKKLFRFDYYRLDKVGGSGESVLLSVKGSVGASILIADDPSFFPRVSSEYSLFVSR
jgi:hypothetical protein